MILLAAIPAAALALAFLLINPFNGVLVTLLVKPIVDASWNHSIFGVNALMVLGVAVPLIVLPRIFRSGTKRLMDYDLSLIAIVFLFTNLIGVAGLAVAGRFYPFIDFLFRALASFLAFFLFQFYFDNRENFRRLLVFLLFAGIFPVLVGIYQVMTGKVWRLEMTSMGMLRNVGLYHDAFTIRFYGYQTLTAILLFWSYFIGRRTALKVLLAVYGLATSFLIYKGYSKTGILIFILWVIIWSIFTRKIHFLAVLVSVFLVFNLASGNRVYEDVTRVFVKEIGAYEGTMAQKYILSGRPILWEDAWSRWGEQEVFEQIFGSGANPPAHNEYLRILICNGIVGVGVFIVLMGIIGFRVLLKATLRPTPLNVMALMVFVMLFLDSLGLHPGLYPAYQWYVYGIITLSLRGVDALDWSRVALGKQI